MGSIFDDFDSVELPEGSREIVYGVNVLQEQARVATVETGTVAELVEKYRNQLGLPTEVVVFVDGTKLSFYDTIPADARRIELIKPAGTKGTCDIPLVKDDAVKIQIVQENTIELVLHHPIEVGKMSLSLEDSVKMLGLEVLKRGRSYLTVGHYDIETKAVRKELQPISQANRRISGGFSQNQPLTINQVVDTQDAYPIRVEINGTPFNGCRELLPGETLLIVLPGETRQADFDTWSADQYQNAQDAIIAADIDREEKVAVRAEELANMNWAMLRIVGASLGVKLAGKGRDSKTIAADILLSELPEIDEEAVYNNYLKENAPELLENED